MSPEKTVELRVNFFDRIDSVRYQFPDSVRYQFPDSVRLRFPLTYVGCIASYGQSVKSFYVRFTYVNINIFASFDNYFFKLIVIYSVRDARKFNAIMTIVLLILRYLNFQFFNLFLQVDTVFWIAKSLFNLSFLDKSWFTVC